MTSRKSLVIDSAHIRYPAILPVINYAVPQASLLAGNVSSFNWNKKAGEQLPAPLPPEYELYLVR